MKDTRSGKLGINFHHLGPRLLLCVDSAVHGRSAFLRHRNAVAAVEPATSFNTVELPITTAHPEREDPIRGDQHLGLVQLKRCKRRALRNCDDMRRFGVMKLQALCL